MSVSICSQFTSLLIVRVSAYRAALAVTSGVFLNRASVLSSICGRIYKWLPLIVQSGYSYYANLLGNSKSETSRTKNQNLKHPLSFTSVLFWTRHTSLSSFSLWLLQHALFHVRAWRILLCQGESLLSFTKRRQGGVALWVSLGVSLLVSQVFRVLQNSIAEQGISLNWVEVNGSEKFKKHVQARQRLCSCDCMCLWSFQSTDRHQGTERCCLLKAMSLKGHFPFQKVCILSVFSVWWYHPERLLHNRCLCKRHKNFSTSIPCRQERIHMASTRVWHEHKPSRLHAHRFTFTCKQTDAGIHKRAAACRLFGTRRYPQWFECIASDVISWWQKLPGQTQKGLPAYEPEWACCTG